jgi:hypothetical protein
MTTADATRWRAAGNAVPDETVVGEPLNTRIREVLAELDRDLAGLAPVKARIRQIAALLVIDRMREQLGLSSERPSLHMYFANARSIRNAIDRARLRQAGRLFELDGPLSPAQLMTIEEQDILASSVFTKQTPAAPDGAAEPAAGLAQ